MFIPVLFFIIGLLCLIKGGDWFVDGSTGIARRFRLPCPKILYLSASGRLPLQNMV